MRLRNLVFLHSCLIGKNNLDLSGVLEKSTCTRTRSSDSLTFRTPIFKTKLFQFSYFIRSVKLWNSLPFDIRSEENPNIFKSSLKRKYLRALTKTFDVDLVRMWTSQCFKMWQFIKCITNVTMLLIYIYLNIIYSYCITYFIVYSFLFIIL